MRIVLPSDWTPMPWKNGGGVTHEILRQDGAAPFRLRLSVATVTSDGPFSPFPGVDRVITLLEGSGFVLTRADGLQARITSPAVPFAFHGEDAWSAALVDGPVRDLNVMVARAVARASVVRVGAASVQEPAFVLALADGVEVEAEGRRVTLPRHGLAATDGPAAFVGDALLVQVTPT